MASELSSFIEPSSYRSEMSPGVTDKAESCERQGSGLWLKRELTKIMPHEEEVFRDQKSFVMGFWERLIA